MVKYLCDLCGKEVGSENALHESKRWKKCGMSGSVNIASEEFAFVDFWEMKQLCIDCHKAYLRGINEALINFCDEFFFGND